MSIIPGISLYRLFENDLKQWAVSDLKNGSGGGARRIEKRLPFFVKVSDAVVSAGGMDQFYFKDRRNRYEAGAIGCARVYASIGDSGPDPADEIGRLWEADPRFSLFGGMSFFDDAMPPEWRSFGRVRFVLPLVALKSDENGCTVVLNCIPPENKSLGNAANDIVRQLKRLDAMVPGIVASGVPPYTETLIPGYESWHAFVDEVLSRLNRNGVRKVVLARKKILKSALAWDPVFLFRCIEAIEEDSFLFFCRPKNGEAFMGRSPERLFNLTKGSLASDAIAGTRRRCDQPFRDDTLASELMSSIKDAEEHRIVVDYIRAHMARLCDDVCVAASPRPLKLKHLQHIITRVRGRVKNGRNPVEIMRMLHPTPAVGGVPRESSLEMISRLEPFGRGWYGAPIGWMARDAAEFAVGIRSALVRENELHLFGGAGIVAQSEAKPEWEETGHKMENFTRILESMNNGFT